MSNPEFSRQVEIRSFHDIANREKAALIEERAELFEKKLAIDMRLRAIELELDQHDQAEQQARVVMGAVSGTDIDPITGKDAWGYTAEDHAQGRRRSSGGLRYDGWNDPGMYDE